MLNTDSPIPLYRQLADMIGEKIRTGEYPSGTRIPSEHKMADRYGVGRPTVRQATDLLIRKGLLRRRRGAGTFVRNQRREVDLFSLAGTLSAFEKMGAAAASEIVSPIRRMTVDPNEANPYANKDAYYFSRIHSVENEPVLLEDIYLHPELFAGIERFDLTGRSLSRIVSDYFYLTPLGGRQYFRIEYPDAGRADMLDVTRKTPLLAVNRFIDFPRVDSGIYSDLFCRTDRFVFSQTLKGMEHEN